MNDPCRAVSGEFLRDILVGPLQAAIPPQGVSIHAAHIVGGIDLSHSRIGQRLSLANCLVDGDVLLTESQTGTPIVLDHTVVKGGIYAGGLRSDADLELKSGTAYMLLLYDATFARMINVVDSTLGEVSADNVHAGDFYLRSHVLSVDMSSARILGQLDLSGMTVDEGIRADAIEIGKSLFMNSRDGQPGSTRFQGDVSLTFARIGDNLNLRGARIDSLDLSGTTIGGELILGRFGNAQTEWKTKTGHAGKLTLRNAKAANLVDDTSAWPDKGRLDLDGFSFNHLGGADGETASQMVRRGAEWWDVHWVRLDTNYSLAPYGQLASVFSGMGAKDVANDIRFLSRQREREELLTRGQWLAWSGQTFLWLVAGYGIGVYTFFVLGWVLAFTLIGVGVLWFTVKDATIVHRGPLWCFGASLSRILPGIKLNDEFDDFFKDPDRKRICSWQMAVFSGLTLIGWVLGAILVAAIAGLTQNS